MTRRCGLLVLPACWVLGLPVLTPAQTDAPLPDHMAAPIHEALARPGSPEASPYITLRVHNISNLRFTITNWGAFGSLGGELIDPETGQPAPGAYFPAGFDLEHLYLGALWVGAVVDGDTLVSTAHDDFYGITEFYPGSFFNGGGIVERSDREDSPYHDSLAHAQQEFDCTYFDTLTAQAYVPADPWSWRPHKPIRLRVRQESFAWSYGYAEDFVIIRYWITNLRSQMLNDVRVGFLIDPQVANINNWLSYSDDQIGFRDTLPSISGYGFQDTVRLMWFADNDGDPAQRRYFDDQSVVSAAGIGVISAPTQLHHGENWWDPHNCWESNPEYSFNWWLPSTDGRYDWGPQRAPAQRSWIGGAGEPLGDRQKYRYMANREIDYDQAWANQDLTGQGWIGPPRIDEFYTVNLARGANTRGLLSVGPFDIPPGDSVPIVLAFACGDNFHFDPQNGRNLPNAPKRYVEKLDFNDLSRNFQWAKWVYDNPGKDTDGDGCSGHFRTTRCRDTILYWEGWPYQDVVCDTIYYSGDGVPDLKGPPPPPSPELSIISEPGKIHLSWDGSRAEPFFDDFAHRKDFEGYNVYLGLGHNPNTLALMASWDRIDYDRYRYVPETRPSPWVNNEPPFTPEELAAIYGSEFNPRPYHDAQSFFQDQQGNRFFFTPHGGNRGNDYVEANTVTANRIQMVGVDSLLNESTHVWELFGRYTCTIDGLLPSQSYYFAVTAFDQGFPQGGLGPLESSTQANMQLAYPSYTPDFVVQKGLNVSVYPNPYKIDDRYRDHRYEDPNRTGFIERTRRINFVNLPPRATIKIFSLDGDLIRELHHPDSRFSDTPSHTAWDMITRNTQAVVSGIYLYSIESEWGNQVGRIVIIK